MSKKSLSTIEKVLPAQGKHRENLEGIHWMRETVHTVDKIFKYGDMDSYNFVKYSKNMAECCKYLTKHKKIMSRSRVKLFALANKQQQHQIKVFIFIISNVLYRGSGFLRTHDKLTCYLQVIKMKEFDLSTKPKALGPSMTVHTNRIESYANAVNFNTRLQQQLIAVLLQSQNELLRSVITNPTA
jgi:hypothetical protein